MGVEGANLAPQARMELVGCGRRGSGPWLQLYTDPISRGTLVINPVSGHCLDVPWKSASSGLDLRQFPCHGDTSRRFRLTRPLPAGGWTIRAANSLCLEHEPLSQGGDVEQRPCSGTSAQKWLQVW